MSSNPPHFPISGYSDLNDRIRGFVADLRQYHPDLSFEDLAEQITRGTGKPVSAEQVRQALGE